MKIKLSCSTLHDMYFTELQNLGLITIKTGIFKVERINAVNVIVSDAALFALH